MVVTKLGKNQYMKIYDEMRGYYRVSQVLKSCQVLQSVTSITKCDRSLLQMRRVFKNVTVSRVSYQKSHE